MPEMAYFSSPFTLHLWILKNYRINIEGDVCLLLKLDLLSEMGKLESVKQQYTNEIIREEVKLIDAGTIVQKNFQFPQLQLLHKQIIIFIYVVYISKSFRIRGQIEKVKDTNRYKIFELLIRSTPMHGQSIDQQGKSNCQWATVVAPPLHLHSVSRNMDLNLRTVYYICIFIPLTGNPSQASNRESRWECCAPSFILPVNTTATRSRRRPEQDNLWLRLD